MATTYTHRERLEMVINENITEELKEDCRIELEKLDARNAARASKVTPHQEENTALGEQILATLGESAEPMQIDSIVEALAPTATELGIEELKRQRVTGICTNLIKDGKIKSEDVKVKGKGKRKAYSLV